MEPRSAQLEELHRFMATRWFVASRAELLGHGFSGSRIKNWYQRGRLVKVMHGVYSLGRDVETREATWRAALLVAGSGSVLTGRSACEQWGLIKTRTPIPRSIEVATQSGKARTHRGRSPALRNTRVEVVRRTFDSGDIRTKGGIPLLRPALALVDFAVDASDRELRFAFLEACRLQLFNENDLKYCFNRLAGRSGARKLRPLLALARARRSTGAGW